MGYLGCLGQAQEGGGGSGLTSEVATAADKSAKNVNTMYRQSTLLAYQRHTHFMYNLISCTIDVSGSFVNISIHRLLSKYFVSMNRKFIDTSNDQSIDRLTPSFARSIACPLDRARSHLKKLPERELPCVLRHGHKRRRQLAAFLARAPHVDFLVEGAAPRQNSRRRRVTTTAGATATYRFQC